MKKQLERFNGVLRLPISSIGNICLLPEEYNRAKGERTIYQYQTQEFLTYEIENKYTFTEKEDLSWIEDFNISQEELKKRYYDFIDKRFEKIKEKLTNIIF